MLPLPYSHYFDPCLRVIALPLAELGDVDAIPLGGGEGLPAGSVDVPAARLLLAATPCSAPMFVGAIEVASQRRNSDALMIRTGLRPEVEDEVTCTVALLTARDVFTFNHLLFHRCATGALWLVPKHCRGPFIHITDEGLRMELAPPFHTWSERADGLCRAAAEIVRLPSSVGSR